METITEQRTEVIDSFNSLLRGEMSAVETYRQALSKINDPTLKSTLTECLGSHQSRVQLIRDKIRELGGSPAESSGPWGAFAKLVEGGAKIFGERAAIAALEEGEDHGLRDYRDALAKLIGDARIFVDSQLVPAQERTHRMLSSAKKTLH